MHGTKYGDLPASHVYWMVHILGKNYGDNDDQWHSWKTYGDIYNYIIYNNTRK